VVAVAKTDLCARKTSAVLSIFAMASLDVGWEPPIEELVHAVLVKNIFVVIFVPRKVFDKLDGFAS